MKRVLIIEDDKDIASLLTLHLQDLGCDTTVVNDGTSGWRAAQTTGIDLIILDVMLPGMNGIELLRRLRSEKIHTPVIMLTARSEEIDKVLGLELGADDYLTKPFSVRELLARVKALFRRAQLQQAPTATPKKQLQRGDLLIDIEKQKVTRQGKRIEVSKREFELLKLLATHPGKSYSRAQLLQEVWGYDFDGYEHTVNSHINRLRTKIEPDLAQPQYILTTWGVGYRFNEEK